jgi:hypothetical protein
MTTRLRLDRPHDDSEPIWLHKRVREIIRGARRIWRTAPRDKRDGEIWFLRKLVDLLLRVLSGLTARGTAIRVRK